MLASWSSAFAAGESGFSSKIFNPPSQHLTNSCVKANDSFISRFIHQTYYDIAWLSFGYSLDLVVWFLAGANWFPDKASVHHLQRRVTSTPVCRDTWSSLST